MRARGRDFLTPGEKMRKEISKEDYDKLYPNIKDFFPNTFSSGAERSVSEVPQEQKVGEVT